MHPPLPSSNHKTHYRRQPLQQIQQSNTNTISENENNKADYEQVLVKQTRALRVSNKTDGGSVLQANNKASSGILLANIVSGNYSRVAINNENDKSTRIGTALKTQHNYSQENMVPKDTRNRGTGGSKYGSGRVAGAGSNSANGSGTASGRYGSQSQSNYYGSGYGQQRYGGRRHTSYHVETTVINKDDLRYTAKYWTASDSDTKPVENNLSNNNSTNQQKQQQDSNANSTNTSTTSPNSSYSSIVDNSHKDTDTEQKRTSLDVNELPRHEASRFATSSTSSTSNKSTRSQANHNQRISYTSQTRQNTTKSQSNQQRTSRHHSSHNQQFDTTSDVKQQQQTIESSQQQEAGVANSHKDGLRGIDLRNHAGVVIVDYLPESSVPGNASDHEDETESADLNDGFQQVMTKKKRKEMKVAAAAAAAASSVLVNTRGKKATSSYGNSRSRRVSFNSDSRSRNGNGSNQERSSTAKTTSNNKKENKTTDSSISPLSQTKSKTILSRPSSAQPASNATTKPGAQKYNQVVNNTQTTNTNLANKATNQSLNATAKTTTSRISSTSEQGGCTISPSVDLNLKIESCKKVWNDISSRNMSHNKETKPKTSIVATESTASTVALVDTKAKETDQSLTDTVIKGVLEPLMKSPVQPLMSIATSSSVYAAFGTTTGNLVAPIQSLNDSGSSAPVSNQSTCSNAGAYLDVYKPSNSSTVSGSKEMKIPSPCHKDSPETVISAAITSNVCNPEYSKALPASPSPSVSSYLSMPSLSNNSFYQPPSATTAQTQPPVAPQQPTQSQLQMEVQSQALGVANNNSQMYQNYYHPFSSYQTPQLFSQDSQMTGVSEDYSQQVLKSQEQYFQNQQSTYNQNMQIQSMPLQTVPPPQQQQHQLYQQGFPSMHSFDQHQQQKQQHQQFSSQQCEGFQMAPESSYNPEFNQSNYHQSNTNTTYNSAISYQQSNAPVVTSANAYNPFTSNPFTTQRSNTNSESNTSFCYSVNNFQTASTEPDTTNMIQQQQHQQHNSMNTSHKNSNSNLYSLFSSSNSNLATSSLPTNTKNPFYNGFNTNVNFQQQLPQITPSTSFGHLATFNQSHRNSPDCFQPKSFDATTAGFNRPMPMNNKNSVPLLDRVPSFDNGIVASNPYVMGGNFNQPMNSDQFIMNNHNQKNSAFFNNNNNSNSKSHGMPGLCNINKMFNMFNDNSNVNNNSQMALGYNANKENSNYYNQMTSNTYQQHQCVNANQPPLLSQPNFQSPLLPQPPQLAPVPYQYMQQRAPMMIGASTDHCIMGHNNNRFNQQQRYQIPNNQQNMQRINGTYGKNYGSSSARQPRSNHAKHVQQSTIKVASPPKPVKKITILPKPKNTSTSTSTSNGISNKPTTTAAAESATSKLEKR